MAKSTFGFTQVWVRDLEPTVDFYSQVLGMRELHRLKYDSDGGIEEVVLAQGEKPAHTLVLACHLDGRASIQGEIFLGFYSDAMDEVIEKAVACGGTLLQEPVVLPDGLKLAIFEDPDGHRVEIMDMGKQE